TLTAGRLLFNLCVTAYFAIGAVHEERRLLAEFGDAYARYREKVPMFLPRPNGYVPETAGQSGAPQAT
ncbi:MAG: isoprenylcysteine carboxylmethyltransferase family protein, partial [Candidatus Methylomirabilis sp.]|nr:isoprenylcysteine carboxylmethyltransferase family protein [Deltaproteobacteria bacterium]